MDIVDLAYEKALEIIKRNITSKGLKASAEFYNEIWTRDSMISALALYFLDNREIKEVIINSITFLSEKQMETGQIPTYIKENNIYWYSIDSTLWWIIISILYNNFKYDKIKKAFSWLYTKCLDKSYLITSLRGTDWMDASLGREGKVLYNNVLWYVAIKLLEKTLEDIPIKSNYIKETINTLFWPTRRTLEYFPKWGMLGNPSFLIDFISENRKHYIHFVSYDYLDDRFDTFSNILACLFGISNIDQEIKIFKYIMHNNVSEPYPIRCLDPPVYCANGLWMPNIDILRESQQRCLPYRYHNGGIWPFIGGFYIAFLVKIGEKDLAKEELEKLARANKQGKKYEWEFNEWLHGRTGEPMGAEYQTWNAASYILAYQSVYNGVKIWNIFS